MAKNITILVGTLGMGLWRSADGGENWKRGRIGEGYQGGRAVFGLAVHPNDPATIYAGADDGIYLSRNRGETFERMDSPMTGAKVWRVTIDAEEPDTLFAGTSPVKVYRSGNAGATWDMVCDDFVDECHNVGIPRPTSIVVDPYDHRNVWVSIEVDGLRRSTDGGDTWERVSGAGLDDPDVHSVAVVPTSPKTILVTTENGVVASQDMGETWQDFLNGQEGFSLHYTRCVAVKRDDPNVIFLANGDESIGSVGALRRTTDGGKTWEQVALPVTPSSHIECFATHPADPNLILACTHYGQLFGSSDGGDWWIKLHKEVTENRGALAWVPN
ncbi:MAG: Uncharacterized protein C1O27_002286 [Chloroflexi bacterium]|jgi:photosystem II stability/assembly factor-like uncharacterized protein|nr:MAG: Uncharacterized protein C1O27_002286 [Chloroflexota bacterium]